VIWMAFIFIYFALSSARALIDLPAVISMTIQLGAFAVLVCLFGSRVFIMIVWPDQNVITTATTSATTTNNTCKYNFYTSNNSLNNI
jgi:metabotropic glutamate receptor 2/3/metabotropic glutamate receptor 6/7/8